MNPVPEAPRSATGPLRAAVVTAAERPAYLVFAVSHVALDAAAPALLQREWLTLLAGQELPETQ